MRERKKDTVRNRERGKQREREGQGERNRERGKREEQRERGTERAKNREGKRNRELERKTEQDLILTFFSNLTIFAIKKLGLLFFFFRRHFSSANQHSDAVDGDNMIYMEIVITKLSK